MLSARKPVVFRQTDERSITGPIKPSAEPLAGAPHVIEKKTLSDGLKKRIFSFTFNCASLEPQLHSDPNIGVPFADERKEEFRTLANYLANILNDAANCNGSCKFAVAGEFIETSPTPHFKTTFSAPGLALVADFFPSGANTPLLSISTTSAEESVAKDSYVSCSQDEWTGYPHPSKLFIEKIEGAALALMSHNSIWSACEKIASHLDNIGRVRTDADVLKAFIQLGEALKQAAEAPEGSPFQVKTTINEAELSYYVKLKRPTAPKVAEQEPIIAHINFKSMLTWEQGGCTSVISANELFGKVMALVEETKKLYSDQQAINPAVDAIVMALGMNTAVGEERARAAAQSIKAELETICDVSKGATNPLKVSVKEIPYPKWSKAYTSCVKEFLIGVVTGDGTAVASVSIKVDSKDRISFSTEVESLAEIFGARDSPGGIRYLVRHVYSVARGKGTTES